MQTQLRVGVEFEACQDVFVCVTKTIRAVLQSSLLCESG